MIMDAPVALRFDVMQLAVMTPNGRSPAAICADSSAGG